MKETLEEAAKAKFPFQPLTKVSITRKKREAFIDGAKWQQEQDNNKYSDEEVLNLLQDFANEDFSSVINIKEWFEQFKKK